MRIAALYDIHGNLPALDAVLREVRQSGVDEIVVGGDVLPGPMPRETIACLRQLDIPTRFIQGNGDRETLLWKRGAETAAIPEPFKETMRWVARQIEAEDERLIEAWPPTLRVEVAGLGSVFFCHATPRNDVDVFTRRTPDDQLIPLFDALDAAIVVCGHTHMQFDRTVGRTRIVNAGSVGMPFQEAGAYWLLLGPDVQLRRTAYDLADAAARIRATAYPQAEDFAARNVLQPPAEEAMLEAFSRVPLKTGA
jgi:putative phosphoesterase